MSELLSSVLPTTKGEPLPADKCPITQAGAGSRNLLRRIDLALLPILAVPLLILKLDDSWLFAYSTKQPGFIDTWVYFGYFLDLIQHLQTFRSSAYYAGRISWILPGFLAYHFFSPVVAACMLHTAFYWVAEVSLYLILKHTLGRRAALLTALMMGCYPYFLWAMGWDYVDGAAITYSCLTLCALTYAAKAERPRRWLVLSGAAFAAAIYCNLFLISFAPLFALHYHFAKHEYGRNSLSSGIRSFAHGVLALTLFFGVLNLALKARPLFFILPSLNAGARLITRGNPWIDSSYDWITRTGWLVFPAVTLVGASLVVQARRLRSAQPCGFRSFWQLYFELNALIMLLWQAVGQPVLQLVYYASLLIPGIFLALGAQFAPVLERFSRRQFVALCCGASLILFLPFVVPLHSGFISAIQRHPLLWPGALGTAAVALLVRQVRYAGAVAVLLVCSACGVLTLTVGTRTWGHPGEPNDPTLQKHAFLAVVDSVRAAQEIDPTDHMFFWYDLEARLGSVHRSVASTFLWSRRLVSESFPLLGTQAETPYLQLKIPPPHTKIAILTVDEGALQKAEQSLSQVGLTARFIEQRKISEGPIAWNMILIETEPAKGSAAK